MSFFDISKDEIHMSFPKLTVRYSIAIDRQPQFCGILDTCISPNNNIVCAGKVDW